MNKTKRGLETAFVVGILFICANSLFSVARAADETNQPLHQKVITPPDGALQLRERQFVLRKRQGGWQVCQVKRFVWQETLVSLSKGGKVVRFIREIDASDLASGEDNGLYVVFEAATKLFPTVGDVKTDDVLLKTIAGSDEFLVKAADIKAPNFALLK